MGMGGGNPSGSLLTSDYAKIKRGHMKLVNNIRATGASVDVEYAIVSLLMLLEADIFPKVSLPSVLSGISRVESRP
jgi:hypothetical protein